MTLAEYYDGVARRQTPHYQQASGFARSLLHAPVERFAHRHVQGAIAGASSVADIGCGFGGYLHGLDHLERVFISDVSPQMVHAAKATIARQSPHLTVSSWTGDIAALDPDSTGAFDLAMCIGMLNHLTDAQLAPALNTLSRLATRTILLYYAHTTFALAKHVGRSYRRQGIHYQCHSMKAVERTLEDRGFRLSGASFVFGLPLVSPLVMQTFHRASHEA